MTTNKTDNYGLPLPHADNTLSQDVNSIIRTITKLDEVLHATEFDKLAPLADLVNKLKIKVDSINTPANIAFYYRADGLVERTKEQLGDEERNTYLHYDNDAKLVGYQVSFGGTATTYKLRKNTDNQIIEVYEELL